MTPVLDRPGVVLGIAALVLNEGATDDNARAVIAAAVDAGVLALDTARAYARLDDDGVGERLAAEGRERRPGLPIITKAGHYRAGASAWHSDGSAERIRADAARSVELLGAPLDLLLLHRADRVDDLEESVATLAALREEGLTRAVGLSNASIELIDRALAVAPIDAVQNRFALGLDSADVYRHCVEHGMAFLAYAPFAGPHADPLATRVPHLALAARARDISVHRAAIATMLYAMPGAWPVVGASRASSALDSIVATELEVDAELRDALALDLGERGITL